MTKQIVISLDFELGWGVLESETWRERQREGVYTRLRPVLARLFGVLMDAELPSTWATVSYMSVEREADLALEHLPEHYRDSVLTFFRESDFPTRCANDLFDQWIEIESFSEMASHTASHVYADCPEITAEAYVRDVHQSVSMLEPLFGQPIDSVVFPRDQARFRQELAIALAPMNFRLNPSFLRNGKGAGRRLWHGGLRLLQSAPVSRTFIGENSETFQTGSMYFNWIGGGYETLKRASVRLQRQRMIESQNDGMQTFHIWLHPFNLAQSEALEREFSSFLHSIARGRDAGELSVLTMRQVGHGAAVEAS